MEQKTDVTELFTEPELILLLNANQCDSYERIEEGMAALYTRGLDLQDMVDLFYCATEWQDDAELLNDKLQLLSAGQKDDLLYMLRRWWVDDAWTRNQLDCPPPLFSLAHTFELKRRAMTAL